MILTSLFILRRKPIGSLILHAKALSSSFYFPSICHTVSELYRALSMKDSLEDQSSPNTPHNSNTNHAPNANQYLNLNNPSNPFRLDTGDNPGIILVTNLLTGDKYATWSCVMWRALRAKNKLAFITRTINQPTNQEDHLFDLFERCNDMVVLWL